jgi:hypothetical protein
MVTNIVAGDRNRLMVALPFYRQEQIFWRKRHAKHHLTEQRQRSRRCGRFML